MHNPLATSSTSQLASSAEAGALPTPWVERLFLRLEAILGPRFADLFHGDAGAIEQAKREWAEALAGFSAAEISRGLADTRQRKFPPSLPEFLHLCRPALDPEVAWIEAELGLRTHAAGERFPWSHPAVYWAARDMRSEIAGEAFAKHRKRWEFRLKAEFDKGFWASPPDPKQRRLAAPPTEVVDPAGREEAKRTMAGLREALAKRAGIVRPQDPEQVQAQAQAEEPQA